MLRIIKKTNFIFFSVYVQNVQMLFQLDLVSIYLFLIFSSINDILFINLGITEFDGKQYHVCRQKKQILQKKKMILYSQPDCFACVDCQKAITSQFYPFNNDYLCGACHEVRFPRKRCTKCGSVITSAGITFSGASYHAACFVCM